MIIGIAGHARSGKDTVADRIISVIPGYVKASFADPMKDMLSVGLKLSNEQLYGLEKEPIDKRYEHSPRFIMQTIGTEWGRKMIHPDIWVNAMAERVKTCTVIPDVRFENEAAFCRKRGILIHVAGRRGDPGIMSHESESGVLPINRDFMVDNSSTLEHLYAEIEKVMEWF